MHDWIDFSLALSAATWVICFNTLVKDYSPVQNWLFWRGSVHFQLLPIASWVLPLSWLGFRRGWESLASDGRGTRTYRMGSAPGCAVPSSRHHKPCNSLRLSMDWLLTLTKKKKKKQVGTSWAWYLHLHIFCQCALPLFHYLRVEEEHMLTQRTWLSKQKGHSEREPWSRENLRFAGFSSGKRQTLPLLGAAAVLAVQGAVGLGGWILVAHVRCSGCGTVVEAQLCVQEQLSEQGCVPALRSHMLFKALGHYGE